MDKQVIRLTEAQLKEKIKASLREKIENGELDEGFWDSMKGFFGGAQGRRDNQGMQNAANKMTQGVKNATNKAVQGVKNAAGKVAQGVSNAGNAVKQNVQNRMQDAQNYSAAADIEKALQTLQKYAKLFGSKNRTANGYNMAKEGLQNLITALRNSEINYQK